MLIKRKKIVGEASFVFLLAYVLIVVSGRGRAMLVSGFAEEFGMEKFGENQRERNVPLGIGVLEKAN